MRLKIIKRIVLFGLYLFCNTAANAQSIHFNFTDGTSLSYNLIEVRKITFDANVMNLQMNNGSVYSWELGTIIKYYYDESSLNAQECLSITNTWEVDFFPNPTSSSFNIQFNLVNDDDITIDLFDIYGTLILHKRMEKHLFGTFNQSIDMSNLPSGSYIFHIYGVKNSIIKQILKN